MSLVVPFDNSTLSRAALLRAAQFDTVLEEGIIAVTVIPKKNREYAREREWIDDGESFDRDAIESQLKEVLTGLVPDAGWESVFVDKYAPRGTIVKALRRFIRRNDASIVFIGSENAGRIVGGLTVGRVLTSNNGYDTMIVSQVQPLDGQEVERGFDSLESRQ